MTGKHTVQKSKKSNIIIIVSIIAVIAAVAVVMCIFLFLNKDSKKSTLQSTSAYTVTSEAATSASDYEPAETQAEPDATAEQGFTSNENEDNTENIIVPTISGESIGEYFTASFTPYKAIDPSTEAECSLKQVFGSAYGGGALSFNSDGTFSDTVGLTTASRGAYAVEGDGIVATYSNDKNILMKIVQKNGDTPSEISLDYGGYDVYFK